MVFHNGMVCNLYENLDVSLMVFHNGMVYNLYGNLGVSLIVFHNDVVGDFLENIIDLVTMMIRIYHIDD